MRPVHASEENDGGTGGVDATLHVQLADVNEGELARGDDVAQEGTAHGWDLQLGIDPGHQGRGLGSLLLRRFLTAAEDAGLAACLGTFEPNNLAFYHRHGLEVVAEEVEPESQLRFWIFGRAQAAPTLD
jgi:GNAT superfamily N-acetyltransferase